MREGYRTVYVQLHRSEGVVSRLIKWQSRGPYAHASFLLDDGTVYESVHRDGVRRVAAATYVKQYAAAQIDVAQLVVTDSEYRLLLDFLEAQLGKPYDRWGVLHFVTRGKQNTAETARWFCSELVYYGFVIMGYPLFQRTQAWEVSPTLLSRARQLEFA